MHNQYYEAILQLRSPTKKTLDFIDSKLLKNTRVTVAKIEKVRSGLDIYLSSQKFARNFGNELLKKFGGELKISERLYSRNRQTSKLIYRVTVFFKPPEFEVNDVIKSGNKILKVTGLGKRCTGLNLKTGKKEEISCKNVRILEIKKTVVSKSYPRLEVIHPESFQSVTVMNPKKLPAGKKANVVVEEGVWVV
jgi:nonsense-mediated mRNA decay protein 3